MSKKLNIVHTVQFYNPHLGGAELVVQTISEELVKKGHKVTVLTSKNENRDFNNLNGVDIVDFDIGGSLSNGLRGSDIAKYQDYLVNTEYDLIMNYAAQQWATDLTFSVMGRLLDRKKILAPCGYSALSNATTIRWPAFKEYFNFVLPSVLPHYNACIYHSGLYQDYQYAKNLGLKNDIVIPNGVFEEEFSGESEIDFRDVYNVKTKFMGLCVANYLQDKGQERVLDCVRKMNRDDFTMVFIGKEGDQLDNLKKRAEGLNVKFCVNIERAHTLAAYFAADIFLFGSHIEASPLVIIEAKASRTPFVSVDCGNVKEWKGGIVCDPDEMADNVFMLLADDIKRQQLADEGWQEWKDRLTWKAVVDKYEELYLRVFDE